MAVAAPFGGFCCRPGGRIPIAFLRVAAPFGLPVASVRAVEELLPQHGSDCDHPFWVGSGVALFGAGTYTCHIGCRLCHLRVHNHGKVLRSAELPHGDMHRRRGRLCGAVLLGGARAHVLLGPARARDAHCLAYDRTDGRRSPTVHGCGHLRLPEPPGLGGAHVRGRARVGPLDPHASGPEGARRADLGEGLAGGARDGAHLLGILLRGRLQLLRLRRVQSVARVEHRLRLHARAPARPPGPSWRPTGIRPRALHGHDDLAPAGPVFGHLRRSHGTRGSLHAARVLRHPEAELAGAERRHCEQAISFAGCAHPRNVHREPLQRPGRRPLELVDRVRRAGHRQLQLRGLQPPVAQGVECPDSRVEDRLG
mmetsp:Transcript_104169/g.324856  ORF Transcript_104169/g.324856 Transcript_104169/m.324856 type:complete len:368 (-) Transcript_104169:490-1593(-)